jgi:hypothetical protein
MSVMDWLVIVLGVLFWIGIPVAIEIYSRKEEKKEILKKKKTSNDKNFGHLHAELFKEDGNMKIFTPEERKSLLTLRPELKDPPPFIKTYH